jgi:hypothetical protein
LDIKLYIIFLIITKNFKVPINSSTVNLYVDKRSVKVEKFFVQNQPFTQLSDHYGITARLIINKEGDIEEKATTRDIENLRIKVDKPSLVSSFKE